MNADGEQIQLPQLAIADAAQSSEAGALDQALAYLFSPLLVISYDHQTGLIEGDALDNTLTGTSLDETFDGKAGNDELSGGNGSDLYLFGRGFGNDRVSDNGDDGRLSIDRIQLIDLNPDDVTLSRISRYEVQIEINDTGEKLVLDGQFFSTTRQGEAMNLINAKYGREPGLKAYTHVSDQFAPFAIQTIPATVSEAPYILDGLLMNETGKRIREQYADTGGFTDHVFAVTSILGYQFIPRIRDLPSKRLYVFDPATNPKVLRGLLGGKVREGLITSNWPDILRIAATMTAGTITPSQILRKLASYPRQNDLAAALREIGRVERTLFMIDWVLDADMQRRTQIGLNKGESHHALKNALRIGRQGEIRDRTSEGQHYRMAGLNLLTAIVIYWNTARLGEAVHQREKAGLSTLPRSDGHISFSQTNTGGRKSANCP